LLFLDISGYTKLAEALGSIGAEGTEVLSTSISTFFETAILMIYSHGGDVIKFCGDALMCTFSPDLKQTSLNKTKTMRNMNEKAQQILGTQNHQTSASKSCQLAMTCAIQMMEKVCIDRKPRPPHLNKLTLRSAQLRGFEAAQGVILDLKIMLGKGTIVQNCWQQKSLGVFADRGRVQPDKRCGALREPR